MAWTDKMVEDLCIMWKQGLTTGEIGKRLGVSKNSIVGKVHRLQLDARPSPIKKKEDIAAIKETIVEIENEAAPKVKAEKKVEKEVPAKEILEVKPTKEVKTKEPKVTKIEKRGPICPIQPFVNRGEVKLTDLDNHTCRWPIGDPKDDNFRFCGKKVRVGQTYCEEHSALAYVKPTKK